ncbi:MAG TPA: ABC transporter substrate-binding protein [Candidatus Binatia bacterium]|nr:ABC transporter substrate-binding protein [Candidatus Binatia bacterium]
MLTRSLASALLLAAFLAGGSDSRAQAPAPTVLRIGTPGNDGNALAFYAQALGFFKRYGIEPQTQLVRFGGGSGIAAALQGKALDVGEADLVAIATAREHGVNLTLLAPSYMYRTGDLTSAIIAARNSGIRSAKDLNGKVIGVASLGGVGRMLTTKWLDKNGADVNSVKFVELPQVSMAAALVRGTIDAAQSGEPNITAAGDDVRILASTYAALGRQVQATAWCATEDWVKSNPESAKRFVAAIHEAAVWGDDARNHEKSAEILRQWVPFPENLAQKMHRAYYGQAFEVSALQPLLDAALEYKSLQVHASARDMLSPYALTR